MLSHLPYSIYSDELKSVLVNEPSFLNDYVLASFMYLMPKNPSHSYRSLTSLLALLEMQGRSVAEKRIGNGLLYPLIGVQLVPHCQHSPGLYCCFLFMLLDLYRSEY